MRIGIHNGHVVETDEVTMWIMSTPEALMFTAIVLALVALAQG